MLFRSCSRGASVKAGMVWVREKVGSGQILLLCFNFHKPLALPGPIATTAKSYCSTPLRDHTSAGRAVVPAFRAEDLLKDIDNVQYMRRSGYPFPFISNTICPAVTLHHPPIRFEAIIPFGSHGSLPLVFGIFFPESSRCK